MIRDYINTATDEEKREAMKGLSVSAPAATYHQHAQLGAEGEPGRHRERTKQTLVESGLSYPTLREGPWSVPDPVPNEEPLGYSVNDMPVVGEPHEQRRGSGEPDASPSPQLGDAADRETVASPSFTRRV
jgi:hypothetical protein